MRRNLAQKIVASAPTENRLGEFLPKSRDDMLCPNVLAAFIFQEKPTKIAGHREDCRPPKDSS